MCCQLCCLPAVLHLQVERLDQPLVMGAAACLIRSVASPGADVPRDRAPLALRMLISGLDV